MDIAQSDLVAAVLDRARVDGSLVMVDDFINHRVEPTIMRAIGQGLADAFRDLAPQLILTAEASGIPPVASPTKGTEYRVEVARRMLEPGQRVLVIDDFLSGGRTAQALGEITQEAGCDLVGMGFIIEKTFMAGRSILDAHGWHVHSLVRIASIADGVVRLHDASESPVA